jgi:hypothetical protein
VEQVPIQRSASNPRDVRAGERITKRRQEFKRAQYRALMQTPAGRYVMFDLILASGVYDKLWIGSSELHARVAVRDFGLELMQMLQLSEPELYQQMESEWWARMKRDNAEAEALEIPRTRNGDHDGY